MQTGLIGRVGKVISSSGGGGGAGLTATSFDGVTDTVEVSVATSGLSNSDTLIISMWFQRPASSGFGNLLRVGISAFDFTTQTSNRVLIRVPNTNGAAYDSAFLSGWADNGEWNHFAAAYDRTTGKRQRYLNGVATSDTGGPTGFALNLAADDMELPRFNTEVILSEIYVGTGTVDLSANPNVFRTADGKPANLGADGSLVTGSAPEIYAPTGNASDNRGSGGDGTVTGAPTQVAGPGA